MILTFHLLFQADIEFDFSMANIEVNGECPIGNVKNQQKERMATYSDFSQFSLL
jgi:hypothetical protein